MVGNQRKAILSNILTKHVLLRLAISKPCKFQNFCNDFNHLIERKGVTVIGLCPIIYTVVSYQNESFSSK